jgi:hypothetical protein
MHKNFGIPLPAGEVAPMPVNWRRGLFRLWVLAAAAWIMGWMTYFALQGVADGFLVALNLFDVSILLFAPPAALLIFGIAAGSTAHGSNIVKARSGSLQADAYLYEPKLTVISRQDETRR